MRLPAPALALAVLLCACDARAQWRAAEPLGSARADAGAVELDGRLYAAGGRSLGGTSHAFEVLEPGSGRWRALADLPRPLSRVRLAAAGGRVLAIGGYTDLCRNATRAGWAYDPERDAWDPIPELPELRAEFAVAVVDERAYVVGGRGHRADRPFRYLPARQRWEILPAPMRTPRYLPAAVALQGRVWVIGGRAAGVGDLASVEVFDPATETWTAAAPLPEPRAELAAAVIGGYIHVGGGERMASDRVFDTHWVYDPDTDAWSAGARLPSARRGVAAAAAGGRLYLLGGSTRTGWLGTLIAASAEVDALELGP
jgi:hypothetical protein